MLASHPVEAAASRKSRAMLHILVRRLIPRLLIVFGVLGAAHAYIWVQLVAPLPAPWRAIGGALLLVLGPSLPASVFAARRLSRTAARPYLLVAYLWFGLATYLLLAAAAAARQVAVALGAPSLPAAALAGGAALAIAIYGLLHVARGPRVRHVEIPIRGLRAPYLIAQLTDVHIGPLLGEAFAARVTRDVNALAPDLIAITGDFVDGRLGELRRHIEPFRALRARDGVFAVTGNHEYYWDPEAWLTHIRSLGIRVLRNEHVAVDDGALLLAGVDDATAGEDVPRALAGRDPTRPVVLLAHHPRTIHRAAAAGVDLQLSGHTHGGQLLPLGWLARLFEPHVAGLARFGASWLYVSEGTGYWGPPMRVGTTQEITAIRLVPA